jgi:branched-chain amino acid transport system ATP-binding protein
VVLLVEHNAPFVMQECDRVVVLDLGSVLASGTPEEIQANKSVREAYLGETDRAVQVPLSRPSVNRC